MKKNPPKNPFTGTVRSIFAFERCCWDCGSNQSVELDHIMGRESDSPFNAYVNCRKCHTNKSHKDDAKRLQTTSKFLREEGYLPNYKDREFIKKHKKLYQQICLE